MARRGDSGRFCAPKSARVFAGHGGRREDFDFLILGEDAQAAPNAASVANNGVLHTRSEVDL